MPREIRHVTKQSADIDRNTYTNPPLVNIRAFKYVNGCRTKKGICTDLGLHDYFDIFSPRVA